jgi:hypothetical protein
VAVVDTKKKRPRSFTLRTVIGKTDCHVFDGDCTLSDVKEVAIVNVHAIRDEHGWLDVLHIHEGEEKIYEYKE